MKKILIISWYYPPNSSIGAQRVKAFSEYLINKGFLVSVVTSGSHKNDNESIPLNLERIFFIRDYNILDYFIRKKTKESSSSDNKPLENKKYSIIKLKMIESAKSFIRNILYWPDAACLWFFKNKPRFKQIVEEIRPDIIFSSSTPHTSHLIASYLSKEYNIPWVAEFRDLWSQNNVWQRVFPLNYCEAWVEKKVLARAMLLVTVSDALKEDLISLHCKETIKVMNGFNLEQWQPEHISNYNNFKKDELIIRYTGKLYGGRRCPRLLFDALNEMDLTVIKITVEFYVSDPEYLNYLIKNYPKLKPIIKVESPVSYKESLVLQKTTDVNLLIEANTVEAKGNLTGKLFEYLSSCRPILAIAHPESEIKSILNHTKAGELLTSKEEIKHFIKQRIKEKEEYGGCSLNLNEKITLQYSRKAQFEKLYNRIMDL
jgi:hypothetical protein